MLTRREVLQSCAALALSPVAPTARAGAGQRHHPHVPLGALVVDPHSDDSLEVADLMAAYGVPSRPCSPHLICQDWLTNAWKRQDSAVSGVTGVAPLFYLERMAWSQGLRVVFLGRHSAGADGRAHSVAGPQAVIDAFYAETHLIDWRRALAHALLRIPAGVPGLRPLNAVRDAAISGDGALFSWVLARTLRPAADRPLVPRSRQA